MVRDLILFGACGLCEQIKDTISDINDIEATWNVVGIIDDDENKWGTTCAGFDVIGGRDRIGGMDLSRTEFLLAFSSPASFLKRGRCVAALQKDYPGIKFATIIDPTAHVSASSTIGEGSFVGANAVIDAKATLGSHCIVLFFSVISRFVEVGDFTFISASVNVTGNKKIGRNCYLGVKTTVNAKLMDHVLLSAGSFVAKDVPARSILFNRVRPELLEFETTEDMEMTVRQMHG